MQQKTEEQNIKETQNSDDSTLNNSNNQKTSKRKWYLIGVTLLIFLILISGIIFISNKKSKTNIETQNKIKSIIPTPTISGRGPGTFVNEKFGYSIKYPETLVVNQAGTVDLEFNKYVGMPVGVQFPNIIISAVLDQPDYYSWSANSYYFSPEVVNNLYSEDLGTINSIKDRNGSVIKYKKISNELIDGVNAMDLENLSISTNSGYLTYPKNKTTVVRKNGITYVINIYYSNDDELNNLEKVTSTFKFIGLSKDPKYWTTVSNPLSSISYPVTWFNYFNQDTQCLELSDIQNIKDIPQKISPDGHNLVQVCVVLGHMSQNPYGTEGKSYEINGLIGFTAMKQSKIVNGLTEHIILQSKSGNEYAELINESGDSMIFHQIVSSFKFNR